MIFNLKSSVSVVSFFKFLHMKLFYYFKNGSTLPQALCLLVVQKPNLLSYTHARLLY